MSDTSKSQDIATFPEELELPDSLAKVNLGLEVIARLSSGLHCIQTLVCPVDLRDTVQVSFYSPELGDSSCVLKFDSALDEHYQHCLELGSISEHIFQELNSKNNLAYKAARQFLDKFHPNIGLNFRIQILKRIPFQAGLGGGSANAASVLYGLAKLSGLKQNSSELLELASSLGSDIPALLQRKLVFVEGQGARLGIPKRDELMAAESLGREIVLLKPDVGVSTEKAYLALKRPDINIGPIDSLQRAEVASNVFFELSPRFMQLIQRLFPDSSTGFFRNYQAKALTYPGQEGRCLSPGVATDCPLSEQNSKFLGIYNDFQDVAVKLQPEVAKAINILSDCKAIEEVCLSGSGSSVFGLVRAGVLSKQVASELKSCVPKGWWLKGCKLLPV